MTQQFIKRGIYSLLAVAVFTGCGQASGSSTVQTPTALVQPSMTVTTPTPTPKPSLVPVPKRLPRGDFAIFPKYRLFGYSGHPGAPGQGRLGIGDLDERVVEIEQRSVPYLQGRSSMPIMELIATTVHASPGPDGLFREHAPDSMIQQHLDIARKRKAMLLLNIQPGRAKFIDELRYYEKWLTHPDVGVALDPEWAVGPNDIPGRVYGSTTGTELNECAAYLSQLVTKNGLPDKVMVYHQLSVHLVKNENVLTPHKGVVLVKSVDGIGSPAQKVETYNAVVRSTPRFVHMGFKLFYEEDVERGKRLMTPEEVLALTPQPEYVLFE